MFRKNVFTTFKYLCIPCGELGSPNTGKATAATRAAIHTHSYQFVQHFRVSKQWYILLSVFGIFNVSTDVDACTDTVRESALNVDSGRKIPCRTGDSNPRLALQTHALPTEPFRPAMITSQKLCGQEGGPGFSFPIPFFPRHK